MTSEITSWAETSLCQPPYIRTIFVGRKIRFWSQISSFYVRGSNLIATRQAERSRQRDRSFHLSRKMPTFVQLWPSLNEKASARSRWREHRRTKWEKSSKKEKKKKKRENSMCVDIKAWNVVGNIRLFDIPLWYLCTRVKFFNRTGHSNKYYNEISILFYNYRFFFCVVIPFYVNVSKKKENLDLPFSG